MVEEIFLSPLDGRYMTFISELNKYFSEHSLCRYRVMVELRYFKAVCEFIGKKTFTAEEEDFLISLENVSKDDFLGIMEIETKVNHDVKAVEYYVKGKLEPFQDLIEMVHFGLTSDDTNNLAYSLMIKDSLHNVLVVRLNELLNGMRELAAKYSNVPMLARTHGQPASPTTFGKEMLVFAERLKKQIKTLANFAVEGKLNGATGNYSAMVVAYPNLDWINFSQKFVESLDLKFNGLTTQILPPDNYIELFDCFNRINNILIGFNQDIWRYISDGWLKLKIKEDEVGSSTMPHKVNPINFENSEGVLGIANALFGHFANKLSKSRLQRDLSDSAVKRFIGEAFCLSLIGYKNTMKGLSKIEINLNAVKDELNNNPEVISEAIQTILRREGASMPYEKLRDLTRGKKISLKELHEFIDGLNINDAVKSELKRITPENYTGLSSILK